MPTRPWPTPNVHSRKPVAAEADGHRTPGAETSPMTDTRATQNIAFLVAMEGIDQVELTERWVEQLAGRAF
jgi:hypothetical protein